MCVLDAYCADPVAPGVWWRDDAEWKLYGRTEAEEIRGAVAQGLPTVDLHVGRAHYVVDLRGDQMTQTNVRTGNVRSVKLIDESQPGTNPFRQRFLEIAVRQMKEKILALQEENDKLKSVAFMCRKCNLKAVADPVVSGVWWRDDKEWKLYEAKEAAAIRLAVAEGLPSIDLGYVVSPVHARGAHYVVDLQEMTQKNVHTGHIRDVKIVNEPGKMSVEMILAAELAALKMKEKRSAIQRALDRGMSAWVLSLSCASTFLQSWSCLWCDMSWRVYNCSHICICDAVLEQHVVRDSAIDFRRSTHGSLISKNA